MTQTERTGYRDPDLYSGWHRAANLKQFIPYGLATRLAQIDLDWVEFCPIADCTAPLALVETAADMGQAGKSVTVTRKLGEMATLPVFVALYKANDGVITGFRIRQHAPTFQDWRLFTPEEWCREVVAIHRQHHRFAHPDIDFPAP